MLNIVEDKLHVILNANGTCINLIYDLGVQSTVMPVTRGATSSFCALRSGGDWNSDSGC